MHYNDHFIFYCFVGLTDTESEEENKDTHKKTTNVSSIARIGIIPLVFDDDTENPDGTYVYS